MFFFQPLLFQVFLNKNNNIKVGKMKAGSNFEAQARTVRLAGGGESRGGEEALDGFFVHTANSRNTWRTATIYIPDLMTPWEVCLSCNESNNSLFAQSCTCLCVKAQENTEVQHCDAKMHFVSKQKRATEPVRRFTLV